MKTCTACGAEKPLTDFYKGRRQCKACVIARVGRYRAANPERDREWDRAYRERHRESETARKRDWKNGAGRDKYLASRKRSRERRAETIKEEWARYYAANRDELAARRKAKYSAEKKRASRTPEQSRLDRERRRARLLNAYVEDVRFDDVLLRDQGVCGICAKPIMEATIEVDHILPLAAGGTHELSNVQLAHRSCNRRKWKRAA